MYLVIALLLMIVILIYTTSGRKYYPPLWVHEELYEMMYMMHELCRNNDINYCILFGTLLGSVREGKIIRWDDDIDIGMFPKDLEKLKKLDLSQYGYRLEFDDHIWRIRRNANEIC